MLLIIMLVINSIFFICLSELNRFHAYISYYGMSTLDYLHLQEQKRSRDREAPRKSKIKIKIQKVQDHDSAMNDASPEN